jgi:hypothetical protein
MIEVAFAKTSITPIPPKGHELAGYISRIGKSSGVHDNVEARMMLLEHQPAILLVNLDLLGVDSQILNLVREIAEKEIGQVKVITVATHTHSAPATLFTNPLLTFGEKTFREEYFKFFEEKIRMALSNLPNNSERCEVRVGRNIVEGVATNREDPCRKIDSELLIVKFTSLNKVKGIILHYAIHPTVLGPENLLISKDIVEYVLCGIYSALGISVGLFLNGAAGNISTRFTRKAQTFEEAKRLGSIISRQALNSTFKRSTIKAVDVSVIEVSIVFKEYVQDEILGYLNLSPGARDRRIEAIREGVEALRRLRPFLLRAKSSQKAEVINLKVGEVSFIFAPFEIHSDISLTLKSKVREGILALTGYTNEYFGYLTPFKVSPSYESLMQFIDDWSREKILSAFFEALVL